jgi:hypothetical protein
MIQAHFIQYNNICGLYGINVYLQAAGLFSGNTEVHEYQHPLLNTPDMTCKPHFTDIKIYLKKIYVPKNDELMTE